MKISKTKFYILITIQFPKEVKVKESEHTEKYSELISML